ncbi:MAG: ABC transporter substrate-binding protein [Deltaproteobacteria bacterium]|nr:ABC transporter substrate-binding protein [Deltaproteobacteria bacterium]
MALVPTEKLTILQPQVRLGDPHVSSDDKNSLSIIFSMYESLVSRDGRGGYCPALAESWMLDSDACTWTFFLRSPVHFHDGSILVAEDVVASLERVRDPSMEGELGTGGVYRSYLEGAVFETLDRRSVRVVTARPTADLLDLIVKFPIVPAGALAGLPGKPVGSGPYRFVGADKNLIVMSRWDRYWGGLPPAKEIHWQAEADSGSRVESLLVGVADLVSDIGPKDARMIECKATVFTSESSVCTAFMCNLQSGACTDRRVRQALNYGLDVPELVEGVMEGAARPLNGPLTYLHFGCDPETPPYPYDPGKAEALLAEAGYGEGLRLVLDVPTRLPDEAPDLARHMAEQYGRIGISTGIREFTDRPGYANMVRAKEIDDACCFDSSPLSSYRVFREKFHSGAHGPWWLGYTNPEVDALIDEAAATPDNVRRQQVYRRIYRIIRDDAPWIFLYSPTYSWGVAPHLGGWSAGNDGLIRLV